MREVRIVTSNRKTTIPKAAIRRAAEIAYGIIPKDKQQKKQTGKKKKKED